MQGFALFRLPYAQEMTYITGEVSEYSSCVALSDKQGFVFAPFAPSASLPILLIAPNQVEILPVENSSASLSGMASLSSLSSQSSPASSTENYHIDFQKLVLSRSIEIE